MPRLAVVLAAIAVLLGGLAPAQAGIVVTVDKSAQRLARKWFSRKYDWSPMPYSIFFDGGYAIHGSYEISHLGRPASHGCIRLHPQNAALLFALVKERMDDTRIVVTGDRPERAVSAKRAPRRQAATRPARRSFDDGFNAAPDAAEPDLARQRWENGQ